MDTDFAGGRLVKYGEGAGEMIVPGDENEEMEEGEGGMYVVGGSCIVRFGFLDFLPMAEATKVLNLDSLALGGPAWCFASEVRLDWEEFVRMICESLNGFDFHQDLLWEDEAAAMTVRRGGERAFGRAEGE